MRYRWDPAYPAYRARSGDTAAGDIRASDAERNDVADKLSRHYADGRLDQVEFKARLDRAIGATTRGDLGGLFDDLPPLSDEVPPPRSRRRRLVPFLLLLALVAVAAGSTIPHVHFPWLLLVVVGLLLWRRADWRRHGECAHQTRSDAHR